MGDRHYNFRQLFELLFPAYKNIFVTHKTVELEEIMPTKIPYKFFEWFGDWINKKLCVPRKGGRRELGFDWDDLTSLKTMYWFSQAPQPNTNPLKLRQEIKSTFLGVVCVNYVEEKPHQLIERTKPEKYVYINFICAPGYGKRVMQHIFSMYPHVRKWRLQSVGTAKSFWKRMGFLFDRGDTTNTGTFWLERPTDYRMADAPNNPTRVTGFIQLFRTFFPNDDRINVLSEKPNDQITDFKEFYWARLTEAFQNTFRDDATYMLYWLKRFMTKAALGSTLSPKRHRIFKEVMLNNKTEFWFKRQPHTDWNTGDIKEHFLCAVYATPIPEYKNIKIDFLCIAPVDHIHWGRIVFNNLSRIYQLKKFVITAKSEPEKDFWKQIGFKFENLKQESMGTLQLEDDTTKAFEPNQKRTKTINCLLCETDAMFQELNLGGMFCSRDCQRAFRLN